MFVGMKTQEKVRKMRVLVNSGNTAGGFLVVAGVLGNFLNFIYNAYLRRRISVEEFGLVSLIGSFLFLVNLICRYKVQRQGSDLAAVWQITKSTKLLK